MYVSSYTRISKPPKKCSYHVAGTGEVVVEQALQSHPTHGPVLVVPKAVVVHGKQIAGQGVIRDLHLHVVIDAVGSGGGGGNPGSGEIICGRLFWRPSTVTYTQFLAARSLWMTSRRAK